MKLCELHIDESVGDLYSNLDVWKTEAERRGFVVRNGTHPLTGDVEVYWTAKDKFGNARGYFDETGDKSGELSAP